MKNLNIFYQVYVVCMTEPALGCIPDPCKSGDHLSTFLNTRNLYLLPRIRSASLS